MKISWLTDVQAPYREPMFCALAGLVDFEAAFFFAEERVRHWEWRPHPGYRSSVVPSWRVPVPPRLAARLGEDVAVLRPGTTADVLRGVDALVTQVWWQPAHVWAMVHARARGIPYLVYAESTMNDRSVTGGPADRLRSWVFRNAGAVVVPGPAAAETARVNGAPAERIFESVNSVDLERYQVGVHRRRRRAAGSIDPRTVPHRFACIGQLIPRKNIDGVLRAFAGLDGAPELEIAGDGVEQGRLRALAKELGVADRVHMLGFLDEEGVLELLARSHTLALPSTEEVYGYTALEAHVAGLQVVVSDRAGIARNLRGRPGTWVVPPDDASLTAALRSAREAWTGWNTAVDADFASPHRAARDIVGAAETACGPPVPAGADRWQTAHQNDRRPA